MSETAEVQVNSQSPSAGTENRTSESLKTEAANASNNANVTSGGNKPPQSVADVIAELEAKDYDKHLPIKDEKGQVQKVKVKDLVKQYYSANTSVKRTQEQAKAQLDATVQELVNYAKANPRDFLARIGHDPLKFSEATLQEQVKMLEMSPEQRRLRELEAERQQWMQEKQQREEMQRRQQQTVEQRQELANLDKNLAEAFQGAGLPRKKFFFQWASALMHDSLVKAQNEQMEKGYIENAPLSERDAVAIVKDKFPSLLKEALSQLEINQLKDWLGQEILEKIRLDNVNRVTNQSAGKRPTGTPTAKPKEPKVFTKDEEFRAWVESKKI